MKMITRRIVLRFPPQVVDKPFIYHLVKDYELMTNVLKATVNPHKEGSMVMELTGTEDKFEQGLEYLRSHGVRIESLSEDIVRNSERCTHCGACTAICPTGALYISRPSMEVSFEHEKCVVCGICVRTCPVRAVEFKLNGSK